MYTKCIYIHTIIRTCMYMYIVMSSIPGRTYQYLSVTCLTCTSIYNYTMYIMYYAHTYNYTIIHVHVIRPRKSIINTCLSPVIMHVCTSLCMYIIYTLGTMHIHVHVRISAVKVKITSLWLVPLNLLAKLKCY